MHIQFYSDSSVMGTENVAERISEAVRHKLERFDERLTRVEIHVSDENGKKHGADDKRCTIEARPRSDDPLAVTAHAETIDEAARIAADKLAQRLDRHFGHQQKHKHDPRPDKVL